MKYPIKLLKVSVSKIGPLAGRPCLLISMEKGAKKMSIKKILKATQAAPRAVMFVGNDPFQWDIWPLCEAFIRSGRYIEVHCTGNYRLTPDFSAIPKCVFVTCWPDKAKIHNTVEMTAHCFVYRVAKKGAGKDGLPKNVYKPVNKQKIVIVPQPGETKFAEKICIEHGYYFSFPW